MGITKICVSNFKSFNKFDVNLGNFNVIVGANASGKSNFVKIFEFLRDVTNSGLVNAVSMQGGVEYLRNINVGATENLDIEIVLDQVYKPRRRRTKAGIPIEIEIYNNIYKLSLRFKGKQKGGLGFEIANDELIQKCRFFKVKEQKKKIKEEIGQGDITILCNNGKVQIKLNYLNSLNNVPISEDDIYPPFIKEIKLPQNTLLINMFDIPFFLPSVKESFSRISIYDFDPKLPKKATPISGKAELEEDGSNLSIILKNIMEIREKRNKLFNLVKDLLPFISDLNIEKFADKSLLFKLQEIYYKKQYLPAPLISDGTINITALIIALYFERKLLTIIEEPERNIHPYLISKVVEMMKDASRSKQIIVTTHNPEIVKYAGLNNLLLISRDEKGFSKVSKPIEKKELETFLKNEIGIEELYVQNLLGI